MPRKRSKAQIMERLQAERTNLEHTLATLSQADMVQAPVVGAWTAKDVLAHLADWEAHMLVWVAAGRLGDPLEHPDPGLTWHQWDAFNQRIYEAHCNQPLDEVLEYFHTTHDQFMKMVEAMPEEELLTAGKYPFLGKDSLYGWLGQYADHDRWGNEQILKWLENRH